jgi:hypothetical protein
VRSVLVAVVVSGCSFTPGKLAVRDAPAVDDADLDAMTDAMTVDAPTDSAVVNSACDVTGLTCPGGQPLRRLLCGQAAECWVGCRDGDVLSPDQARLFCDGLGMKLGIFDSANDEICVRMVLNGSIMLGMTQAPGQLLPGDAWTRISDGLTPTYFNWGGGQPSDVDAIENGEEQCATSNTSSEWHDVPCGSGASARWICRR